MSLTQRSHLRRGSAVTAAFLAVGLAAALPGSSGSASTHTRWQRVIVSGTDGALGQVEHAVRAAGGHISHVLRVVDGVSARVPATSVPMLRSVPGVRAVTPDATGHLMDGDWSRSSVDSSLGSDVHK